ncbi:MAG: DUF2569 domain-containing protein [Thermoanaerobaculia bacterium]|nr:DUF2569 domain-containing protein [Thermoanaerobaculia bacterium]
MWIVVGMLVAWNTTGALFTDAAFHREIAETYLDAAATSGEPPGPIGDPSHPQPGDLALGRDLGYVRWSGFRWESISEAEALEHWIEWVRSEYLASDPEEAIRRVKLSFPGLPFQRLRERAVAEVQARQWSTFWRILGLVATPPLALLGLGWMIGWVWRGFRSNSVPVTHSSDPQIPVALPSTVPGGRSEIPEESSQPLMHPGLSALIGVRGWLLFLCILLTIVSPLLGLGSIAVVASSPGNLGVILLFAIVVGAEVALNLVAGLRLWQRRPGAVRFAKRVLVLNLILGAFTILLDPNAGDYSSAESGAAVARGCSSWLRAAIFTAIWYSYLSKSKRVAATYAAPPT